MRQTHASLRISLLDDSQTHEVPEKTRIVEKPGVQVSRSLQRDPELCSEFEALEMKSVGPAVDTKLERTLGPPAIDFDSPPVLLACCAAHTLPEIVCKVPGSRHGLANVIHDKRLADQGRLTQDQVA